VPASTTDADAVTTAQSLWQALHARRWWFAAALGIYLLLFALGRFGVFTKVGTFWAWMLVAVLSVAAGIFAAFDKTGFNWTTFFKYVTAGPTIAYLRDFGKDVLLVKLREWKTKAPPAGPAGPAAAGPLAVLLICVGLGLSSCATWQQNTASACDAAGALAVSASTVGAQQWATACETAARTCKANNDQICQALVKCQSDRHVFEQVIIGVHTARVGGYAAIIAADKIKAKSYVDALATAVKTITDTLAALGVHL
jgi:hypothetical protein